MRKDKIDTLLVFCLSFTVVFGGWFLTKGLLHCKENEMLTAKGRIVLDNTKADGEENNPAMQEDFVPQVLSEDEMDNFFGKTVCFICRFYRIFVPRYQRCAVYVG